jgi:AhpD family alkylhydroperoxidase
MKRAVQKSVSRVTGASLSNTGRATLPFVLKALGRRPDILHSYREMGKVVREPKYLSKKEAELVAVAAAVALRCDFCIRTHTQRALNHGSNLDEIFEVVIIAGLIAKSTTYAHGLRLIEEFKDQG